MTTNNSEIKLDFYFVIYYGYI